MPMHMSILTVCWMSQSIHPHGTKDGNRAIVGLCVSQIAKGSTAFHFFVGAVLGL
jgi:hypothetical protein